MSCTLQRIWRFTRWRCPSMNEQVSAGSGGLPQAATPRCESLSPEIVAGSRCRCVLNRGHEIDHTCIERTQAHTWPVSS